MDDESGVWKLYKPVDVICGRPLSHVIVECRVINHHPMFDVEASEPNFRLYIIDRLTRKGGAGGGFCIYVYVRYFMLGWCVYIETSKSF